MTTKMTILQPSLRNGCTYPMLSVLLILLLLNHGNLIRSSDAFIIHQSPVQVPVAIPRRSGAVERHVPTTSSPCIINSSTRTSTSTSTTALTATPTTPTQNLAIAGKIIPFLKFVFNRRMASKICLDLQKATSFFESITIASIGWFSEPFVRFVYEKWIKKWRKDDKDFDQTYIYNIWKLTSEVAKIASIVYAVDCIEIALSSMRVGFALKYNLGDCLAAVLYTAWIGRKASVWKKSYIQYKIRKSGGMNKSGRFFLYNRISDVVISITTALYIADHLQISTSTAFTRFFALGGVGTLVLSLASKGIAEQFVGGLALSTTDKFFEGDAIQLGDGTSGAVIRTGWMSTDIRKSDETIIRVPNGQVAQQRVTNLSRTKLSQVTQTIRCKYSDIDKISQLVIDIKDEVRSDCPKLITDGTRPCRVHWHTFNDDHIEINVDFRFRIPLIGDPYHDNKQKCNIAIARAMKNNDVEFAIPTRNTYEYSVNNNNNINSKNGQQPYQATQQINEERAEFE
jgi:small-conductance mechanosensitive channel